MNCGVCLQVKDLVFGVNQTCLLDHLSFSLHLGQLLQLIGANGSGKSTLLKLLAGLQKEDDCSIQWMLENKEQSESQIAYVGHQNGLKNDLTVNENLEFSLAIFSQEKKSAKNKILKEEFLSHYDLVNYQNKLVKYLSFGQKRKVALGRLFVLQKNIWLLDEPFVGLDESSVAYTKQRMQMHCAQGGSVIMTAHSKQIFDTHINTIEFEL